MSKGTNIQKVLPGINVSSGSTTFVVPLPKFNYRILQPPKLNLNDLQVQSIQNGKMTLVSNRGLTDSFVLNYKIKVRDHNATKYISVSQPVFVNGMTSANESVTSKQITAEPGPVNICTLRTIRLPSSSGTFNVNSSDLSYCSICQPGFSYPYTGTAFSVDPSSVQVNVGVGNATSIPVQYSAPPGITAFGFVLVMPPSTACMHQTQILINVEIVNEPNLGL